MQCNRCEKRPVIHVTRVKVGQVTGEEHYCEECWKNLVRRPSFTMDEPPVNLAAVHGEVPVEVDSLIFSEIIDHQTIIFKEVGGTRTLPFIAGIFEVTCI